jgi:hypothetical protein
MWMKISAAVKAGHGSKSAYHRSIKADRIATRLDVQGQIEVWIMDESKQIMKLLDLVTAQQATIDGLTREAPKPEPKLEVVTVKPMKIKPKTKKNKAPSRKIKRALRPVSPAKKSSAASDWSKTI